MTSLQQCLILFILYEVLWFPLNDQSLRESLYDWKANSIDFLTCASLTVLNKYIIKTYLKRYSPYSYKNIHFSILVFVLFIINVLVAFLFTLVESRIYFLMNKEWNISDQIINTYGLALLSTLIITTFLLIHHMNELRDTYHRRERDIQTIAENKIRLLQSHIEPHFLFNSLSVAIGLIGSDSQKAVQFLSKLAKVYRSILRRKDCLSIFLVDEIDDLINYIELMKIRHGECFILSLDKSLNIQRARIISGTLLLIAENIFKHSKLSSDFPIRMSITIESDMYIVKSDYRPTASSTESHGIGQNSIIERYKVLGFSNVVFSINQNAYVIKLPVIYDK